MIGRDNHEEIIIESWNQGAEPIIEFSESIGVANRIAPMPVKHIEVDKV